MGKLAKLHLAKSKMNNHSDSFNQLLTSKFNSVQNRNMLICYDILDENVIIRFALVSILIFLKASKYIDR